MTNIFDIIADMSAFVIREATPEFFLKYSCVSHEQRELFYRETSLRLPELFTRPEGGVDAVRCLGKEDMTESLHKKLMQYREELKEKKDLFRSVVFLEILDEALTDILLDRIHAFQQDNWSVVLNENRETTGIGILPRCSCVWERKNRLAHRYSRLDNYLRNILILRNDIMEELIDRHIYLKDDFFPKFKERRGLKVAATPLRIEKGFDWELYEKDRVQYFRIRVKDQDHSAENELIWSKILKAGEEDCDILLFPEMLGNPDMVDYLQRRIEKKKKAKIPPMIILPSLWENDRNTVTVMGSDGQIICRQQKQNPFITNTKNGPAMEGILQSRGIYIFHYEGVGRIAIMICKDFLTTMYLAVLMQCFKLTMIIVPSFSTGSYDFRQSFDICANDDCNVVWINTCAAMEKGKEANFQYIGHVRKRINRNEDDSLKLRGMKICDGAMQGRCDHKCIYFDTISEVMGSSGPKASGPSAEEMTAAEFLHKGMADKEFLRKIAENCRNIEAGDPKDSEVAQIRHRLTVAGRRMGCSFTEIQMGEALNNLKDSGFIRVIFRYGRMIKVIHRAEKTQGKGKTVGKGQING